MIKHLFTIMSKIIFLSMGLGLIALPLLGEKQDGVAVKDYPRMITPTPGSVFDKNIISFFWDRGDAIPKKKFHIIEWHLSVGSSPGKSDIYDQFEGSRTSDTLTNLPKDGRSIFVRLKYRTRKFLGRSNAQWSHYDFSYQAFDNRPQIVCPKPGSILADKPVNFIWETNDDSTQNWKFKVIGNGRVIFQSGILPKKQTSITVNKIRTSTPSVTIHLSYYSDRKWHTVEYDYQIEKQRVITGMWVWDQSILDRSVLGSNGQWTESSRVNSLITFCHKWNITEIAFAINWNDSWNTLRNKKKAKAFLRDMHHAGIKVEVLSGNPDWIQGANGFYYGKKVIDNMVDFQFENRSMPSLCFDGIHLDVEPHGLTSRVDPSTIMDWENPEDHPKILQGLYDMLQVYQLIIDGDYPRGDGSLSGLAAMNAKKDTSTNLRPWQCGQRPLLTLDVVPWYDDENIKIKRINGRQQEASTAIYGVPDRISLMSYRDRYGGINGLEEFSNDALTRLVKLGKETTIGLEFQPLDPPHVTFYDNSYNDVKRMRILSEQGICSNYPVIRGFMYHFYCHDDSTFQEFMRREIENKKLVKDWKFLHGSSLNDVGTGYVNNTP